MENRLTVAEKCLENTLAYLAFLDGERSDQPVLSFAVLEEASRAQYPLLGYGFAPKALSVRDRLQQSSLEDSLYRRLLQEKAVIERAVIGYLRMRANR